MVLRKSFYIRWSAGRSPRVHEVKSGSGSFNIAHTIKKNREKGKKIKIKNYVEGFTCNIGQRS